MSRTVNFPTSRTVRLGLAVLIGCLGLHFLLEDFLFFRISADAQTSQMGDLRYDEFSHLDDLVLLPDAPISPIDQPPPAILLCCAVFKKQPSLSILTPPKIA